MRKSTTVITLTLLGPTLLAAGCARDCDPAREDCSRRGATGGGGFFYGRGGTSGGRGSFSGTSRGGFGASGGAGHAGGFSAGG